MNKFELTDDTLKKLAEIFLLEESDIEESSAWFIGTLIRDLIDFAHENDVHIH